MADDLQAFSPDLIKNIVADWKRVVMSPTAFFDQLPLEGDITEGAIFVAAIATVNAACTLVFGIFNPLHAFQMAFTGLIGVMIGSFIHAGITMGLSRLFGGKGGYVVTYRTCAYAMAPGVFSGIPILGALFGLYSLYLSVLAVKRCQDLTTGKAIAVVAIEVVLTLAFVGLMAFLAMAAFLKGHM